MLGEVALVPKESPINQSGLMSTTIHFSMRTPAAMLQPSQGFSEVIEGFMDMTEEELRARRN